MIKDEEKNYLASYLIQKIQIYSEGELKSRLKLIKFIFRYIVTVWAWVQPLFD